MLQVRMILFIGLCVSLKTFRMNVTTPLECWREVTRFKVAVASAETVREALELFTLKINIVCSDTSPHCNDTFT
jgi:hypothetical protein